MKVLHVIPSISRNDGGPTIAVETMTRALAEAGVEVHLAATDDDGNGHLDVALESPVRQSGVTYFFFRRQMRFYKTSLPLARWLARHVQDYDVLHVHTLFSFSSLPAAWAAQRVGVPYIVRPLGVLNHYGIRHHHPALKRISFRLLERRLLERAALIHYTTEQESAEAASLGFATRGVVIPIGIDVGAYARAVDSDWIAQRVPQFADRPLILFMSRLDPKKGLDLLLPAFARLKTEGSNAALLIAGAGEAGYVNALKQRAADLHLQSDIVWLGHLEGEDKRAALHAATVFVLASYSENFGIAVVEALAAGLPVVVTDQVGIHSDITRNSAGIVIPTNVEALATALAHLLQNAELRHTMGQAGRALARSCYSLEAMTHRLVQVYSDLHYAPLLSRRPHL